MIIPSKPYNRRIPAAQLVQHTDHGDIEASSLLHAIGAADDCGSACAVLALLEGATVQQVRPRWRHDLAEIMCGLEFTADAASFTLVGDRLYLVNSFQTLSLWDTRLSMLSVLEQHKTLWKQALARDRERLLFHPP